MSWVEAFSLIMVAIAAGAINAVAGGGTLITFPTLLFFNTSAVVANATSTLALVLGTSGSIYGFRNHLEKVKPWLWRFVPVSIIGGVVGSVLLTRTTEKTFSKLVPFLILFASILFLLQGAIKRFAIMEGNTTTHRPLAIWLAMIFQCAVSVYGGFFGAGIGILMLAWLGLLGLQDLHEMNTIKTILSTVINVVAAVWFIWAGLIDWPKMSVMAIGAIGGYYLGSHYSQRISQRTVRHVITSIGFIISAVTFYKEFF